MEKTYITKRGRSIEPINIINLGADYVKTLKNAGYEKIVDTNEIQEWTHPETWWQIIEVKYEEDENGKVWTCFEEKSQNKKTYITKKSKFS